ncbi:tetratricopeptide repeat protein [Methanotorris igneus]|uniref:Tetratricopeptide TPR_3 repeat-containing protein n=1 Tax=Methanotorris igneus (strain DSM 5666 / JCM 11834 / Kol 5) TaxID=880724 RepID=F6BDU7_METIK|nr:tetratricopeptide repeat protein [Methanotorris igneus]AEF96658.1 Tetratricopeptide TPR_3 repeat-containing protein [Methanotorris igneus Kol 5]
MNYINIKDKNKGWLDALYSAWCNGCKFYNKKEYNKAMKYFNLLNQIFRENVPKYDFYELREEAYKEILNNNIQKGIKKFIWHIEGILLSKDYYSLSGELITVTSILTKIGKYNIAKCFLNIGAERIYEDIKDIKPESILKEVLNSLFGDEEIERIKRENNLENLIKENIIDFNIDYFNSMMDFFMYALNWERFLKIHEEVKNKIKKCKISREIIEKIIERFEESMSDKLSIAYLLKGDYAKCLEYMELFKRHYGECLKEYEIEKNKFNLIEYIANSLKDRIIKKEEWIIELNEIYKDILNKPLKPTYKETKNCDLEYILDYYVLKSFIESI